MKAKEFNQLGNEGVYGVTKFSDLSETEFATKVLMRRQPNAQVPRGPGDVPVTVDVARMAQGGVGQLALGAKNILAALSANAYYNGTAP